MSEKDDVLSRQPLIPLTDYGEHNRPQHQYSINGIALNPRLRPDFDMTDRNDRDPDEVKDWWNKPYIITKSWSDVEAAFEADRAMLHAYYSGDCQFQQEQLERAKLAAKRDWFDKYPYGVKYEIRCLDGRIPDRSTVWGTEGSLRTAIARAKAGPPWGKEQMGSKEESC